jgi:hypothetical protein
LAQAVAAMRDDAEFDRTVENVPVAALVLDEGDRFADQRRADVDLVSLPFDLTALPHASYEVVGTIFRLAQHAVEAPQ